MINIRNLIDWLPFYYKANDTYKDSDGKGLLEKFLEVCGNYFTDNIKSEIDSSLDILDPKTTAQYYLKLLWEMMGQMPFARTTGIAPVKLTEKQQRDIIRYTNTLLKIRGTKQFFEIMFRLYNNSQNNLTLASVVADSPGWDKDVRDNTVINKPYYDYDSMDDDNVRMDEYYRMKQCIKVTFTITGTFASDTEKQSIAAFIRRFVPYFVDPVIKVNGTELKEKLKLKLFRYDEATSTWPEALAATLLTDSTAEYEFLVLVVDESGTEVPDATFESWINSGSKTVRTSGYTFTVSGLSAGSTKDTYHFKFEDQTIEHEVSKKVALAKTYAITTPVIISDNKKITEANPTVTVKVKATETIGTIVKAVSVTCVETGVIKSPDSEGFCYFTLDEAKEYHFAVTVSYTTQSNITIEEVKEEELAYDITVKGLSPKADTSFSKSSVEVAQGGQTSRFQVKIKCNNMPSVTTKSGEAWDKDKLAITLPAEVKANLSDVEWNKIKDLYNQAVATVIGSPASKLYPGSTYVPPAYGTYTLKPVNAKQANELNAIVTKILVSINWQLSLYTGSNNMEITDDNGITFGVQAVSTGTPIGNEDSDNLLKSMVFKLPDGSEKILKYSDTKVTATGITIQWEDKSKLKAKVTTTVPGRYSVKMETPVTNEISINVALNKPSQVATATGIKISPEDDKVSAGWDATPENPKNADRVFTLSETNDKAEFKIVGCDDSGNGVALNGTLACSNGKYYELDKVYTFEEPGEYLFTLEDSPTFKVKLTIQDWESTINLTVTPSTGVIKDGSASTKLGITSNKPGDTLMIKEVSSGDIYKDGDTFSANLVGKYEFIPVVNGTDRPTDSAGNSLKKEFNVTDPSAVTVTPISLEWDAENTSIKEFTIDTGDNTEWVITQV